MKSFVLLFAALCGAFMALSQTPIRTPSRAMDLHHRLPPHRMQAAGRAASADFSPPARPARTANEITVIKIGEASNAYSTLASEVHPLTVLNGTGQGGTLAFVYRHNVQKCFPGQPADNGRVRYSISTDGGQSWFIGGGLTASAENPVPPNQCLGIGPLNQAYTYRSRFPMAQLFQPDANDPAGISLEVVTATLDNGDGGWNGSGLMTVSQATEPDAYQATEAYPFTGRGQWYNSSLVERVPGEFWFVTLEDQTEPHSGKIFVYKGIYNPATRQVEWQRNATIQPNHALIDLNNAGQVNPIFGGLPNIAFSPDGQTGYISFLGDLAGGQDTVISPVLIESSDGGQSWKQPYEFDMSNFQELRDSLQFFVFVDTVGLDPMGNPILDTLPFATGKATTAFEHDLVVDANGNPHLLAVVGPASTVFSPQAGYFISTGLMLMMYDFTRDEFGDWNMLHVASVSTFRASFPLTQTTVGNIITQDNHVQMSRSPDGSKIFMAWLDTDTTDANYQAISSPNDTLGTLTNIAPDLFVRAYDLNSGKMSKVKNWTGTDPTWGGSILLPKLAPLSLNGPASGQHTLPLVFANIDGATALLPTSYYYIQDIRLDEATDFTEEARFFFNCKRTPFANTLEQTAPACGQANGAISLNPAGGTPPFRFQWQAIQGDSSISLQQGPDVSGLPAGIYQLRIVDANGCADEKVVLLNDQSSPQLSLKSSSDISCFGANDGQAEIAISGGSGPYTILWSNGESAAAAQALPAGISSVRVSDSAGCSSFLSVQVDEPSPILLDLNLSHLSCHGAADGAIQVRVSGGNPPFTYAWSNGDTTALLQQAAGGEYSLLLTDANGCTQQAQALLNEPPPLAISTQVVGDNTATEPPYNGRAFVSGTGGTPFTGGGLPYRFLWCDGLEANFHPALPGGPCEVILTDANGCEIRDTVIVGGVTPVSITSPETGILALSLFPNPNKGNFELRLKLSSPQEVQLQVFDMHGRRLYNRKTPHISSLHTPISLPGLPAGVYLLRLSTSQGTASRRFVLTGR